MSVSRQIVAEKTTSPPFVVAIDGLSACGKSATALGAAQELGFAYLDTGAMYRSIASVLHDKQELLTQHEKLKECLNRCSFSLHNLHTLLLNQSALPQNIHQPHIARYAAVVAMSKRVRTHLTRQQRQLAAQHSGLVVEGRDTATIVFPEAQLKIFMTADIRTRAQRRWQQWQTQGIDKSLAQIQKELQQRDLKDQQRHIAPLTQHSEAKTLDTSTLTLPQQIDRVVRWTREKQHARDGGA